MIAKSSASARCATELSRWLARRPADAQAAITARAKALNAARRSTFHARAGARTSFGDLCEVSEGRAVRWRREGRTEAEMWKFVNADPFILDTAIPLLRRFGFSEQDVLKYVPQAGPLMRLALALLAPPYPGGVGLEGAAVVVWMLMPIFRKLATMQLARLQNRLTRPLHYEQERARRQALAAERRRIVKRTTTNPCPTRAEVLHAWAHIRDTKEALLHFGSLMQDLECYLDNTLIRDANGRIVGRRSGVKGWLRANAPELATRYTTVIRYKAATKKLRQALGLADPVPLDAVLTTERARAEKQAAGAERRGTKRNCNYGAEKKYEGRLKEGKEGLREGEDGVTAAKELPPEVARARRAYRAAMREVPDVVTHVLARIDALVDPEQAIASRPVGNFIGRARMRRVGARTSGRS